MQTHFGFQTIDEQEKEQRVRGVFDSVASRYDVMNDLMSGGLQRLWKREMVSALAPHAGMNILDVAGGTGDIAFRILSALARRERDGTSRGEGIIAQSAQECPHPNPPPNGEGIHVTICDINESMLNEGINRAIDKNLYHTTNHQPSTIRFVCGNAESLPFPDAHFDAYTIAFGIRNVTHIDRALAEAHRVLKIGGRFLCLEFSQVQGELLRKIYDTYSFNVIPWVGEKVTHDRAAYQYLVESIRRFPDQQTFAALIKKAGFGNVTCRNMTGGVVALHSGRKL